MKKLIYVINIIIGVLMFLFAGFLRGGASSLSGSEVQTGYMITSALYLVGFLMVVGAIGGFLGKPWGKYIVIAGAVIGALATIVGGSMFPVILLAAVAIVTYIKG